MANNQSLKNQLAKRNGNAPTQKQESVTLKALLASPNVKKRFEEVLKNRAPQYMTSIINLYSQEKSLQKCEPMSVIASAMVAASLDLPIDKNLGYAWIVPYKNKAQFQLGYKGYIQLALRSGQYRYINAIPIHKGELKKWNPLTEEIEIDFESKESDEVIGYAGYFELLNGFRKTVYWTKEQIEQHRRKFSKSSFGWDNDWDAMALKTVIKNLLSKWGILSIDMQKAVIEEDKDLDDINHDIDNDDNIIDIEYEEESSEDQSEDQEKGDEKED